MENVKKQLRDKKDMIDKVESTLVTAQHAELSYTEYVRNFSKQLESIQCIHEQRKGAKCTRGALAEGDGNIAVEEQPLKVCNPHIVGSF